VKWRQQETDIPAVPFIGWQREWSEQTTAGGECAFKAIAFEVETRGSEAVGRQFDGGKRRG
jgi:hypothetical protein